MTNLMAEAAAKITYRIRPPQNLTEGWRIKVQHPVSGAWTEVLDRRPPMVSAFDTKAKAVLAAARWLRVNSPRTVGA